MIEKRSVPDLIGHLVLIIGIIMMAFPIYYTFIASTTTSEAIIRPPISLLSAHTVSGVYDAMEAAGANLIDLPPYSSDFNPIEMAFSKLKALLRTAAARTIRDLWQAIAEAIKQFKPDECRNYFQAAGYDAF